MISEGCSPIGPILNHLLAPLTSIPIPGTKTKPKSNIPKPNNKRSKLSQKFKGTDIKIPNNSNPTSK